MWLSSESFALCYTCMIYSKMLIRSKDALTLCFIVSFSFRLSKVFEELLQKWVLSSDRPQNPDIKQ